MRSFILLSLIASGIVNMQATRPEVTTHVATLQAAKTLDLKITVTHVGGGTEQHTLMFAKDKCYRWEGPGFKIYDNGTTHWTYTTASNTYTEDPSADQWKTPFAKTIPWIYSAFFDPKFAEQITSAKDAGVSSVRGVTYQKVTVTDKASHTYTLLFDANKKMFVGANYETGEENARETILVNVTSIKIGSEAADPNLFAFVPPDGAQKAAAVAAMGLKFSDVQSLINTNCGNCHTNGGMKGGVDLSSYATIMNGRRRLVSPGDGANSRLIRIIRSGQMPPGGKMPDDQIAKLEKWINDGAKE